MIDRICEALCVPVMGAAFWIAYVSLCPPV